ncbi:MAG: hypothetical protein PHS74_00585 [Lachnospiraceae bacterium]|nr:hypothetical protein [Lachnospiraceae bacterium]
MSTVLRAELSEKNKYWIDKHRYYELKHFCLQYPIWKKSYQSLDGMSKRPSDFLAISNTNETGDPTAKCAIAKDYYSERVKMIEQAAQETDAELGCYILSGVTEGCSYDILRARKNIPCCKDVYYELYRRFFWLLDNTRN